MSLFVLCLSLESVESGPRDGSDQHLLKNSFGLLRNIEERNDARVTAMTQVRSRCDRIQVETLQQSISSYGSYK